MRVLLRKLLLLLLRDPVMYTMRLSLFAVVSSFFSALYIDSRSRTQEQVFPREFLQWWVSNLAPSFGILPLLSQSFDVATITREMKDGMYHPSAYVLAHGLVQLPMMFALAAASLAPVFAMADWPWSAFPMHLVISATTLWAFEGAAQLFSLLPHPVIGLLTFIVTWFTGLLMNGFMLPAEKIFWPVRILTYILPLRWTVRASAYALFHDTPSYSGALNCSPSATDLSFCTKGFYCPGVPPQQCWGATGPQILTSLSQVYDVYSSDDASVWAILIICAWAVGYKVVYFQTLSKAITGEAPREPLDQHRISLNEQLSRTSSLLQLSRTSSIDLLPDSDEQHRYLARSARRSQAAHAKRAIQTATLSRGLSRLSIAE